MGTPEPFREHEIDWGRVRSHLDERGFAVIPGVLMEETCDEIAAFYADDHRFRTRIEMSRYSFGQGEYKYFDSPLPPLIQQIRSSIYPCLAPLANEWLGRLGSNKPWYPDRPVLGACGYYRANLGHGVSTIHSGDRYTLGVIFHDAK